MAQPLVETELSEDRREIKVGALRAEFERLLQFHADSFRDIDEKAKYWLTIALPSFLAILGYLFENADKLSAYFIASSSATGICLLASTYFLSAALQSRFVEGEF
jgi:hypothetical protein